MVVPKKLDDIPLAHPGPRLHPLTIDLDAPAAASLGRVPALLEEADQFEPMIDAMSFHVSEL